MALIRYVAIKDTNFQTYKNIDMKQKTNKFAQFKQWILSIVIGSFKYKYEYYSPFGESWDVYRLWFGFIPIVYQSVEYKGVENQDEVKNKVRELNSL